MSRRFVARNGPAEETANVAAFLVFLFWTILRDRAGAERGHSQSFGEIVSHRHRIRNQEWKNSRERERERERETLLLSRDALGAWPQAQPAGGHERKDSRPLPRATSVAQGNRRGLFRCPLFYTFVKVKLCVLERQLQGGKSSSEHR